MATFPTLDRVIADDRKPDTGLFTVTAPDGSTFGQSLYDDEYFVFTPTFISVTEAEVTTLKTFYTTNKLIAFDFEYVHTAGASFTTITYECYFVPPGIQYIPQESGTFVCRAWFRGKEK